MKKGAQLYIANSSLNVDDTNGSHPHDLQAGSELPLGELGDHLECRPERGAKLTSEGHRTDLRGAELNSEEHRTDLREAQFYTVRVLQ